MLFRSLSLVSCPVALFNASSSSDRVAFNTLNRKTGNRLKQLMIDSVTQEPVDPSDRVKGYEASKGQYVMVEDTELEALKIESTKMIEIESFVPASEIDSMYLDSPYYLAPDDKVAQEAFAVIREAMARKNVVGIGRIVLARRERMVMLQPRGVGIQATTLRYPYEVRKDAEYFAKLGIVDLVASFTTQHPCCAPRVDNIHRMADIVGARVIEPGKTFSLNGTVGRRTPANGFKAAPTIDGNGNFAMGLKEQIVFPEIEYDKVDMVRGMDIIICTTAKTDAEAKALLRGFDFPFVN